MESLDQQETQISDKTMQIASLYLKVALSSLHGMDVQTVKDAMVRSVKLLLRSLEEHSFINYVVRSVSLGSKQTTRTMDTSLVSRMWCRTSSSDPSKTLVYIMR